MSQIGERYTLMQTIAENTVLSSGEWLTRAELNNISLELDEWERSGKIFSVHHDNTDYYPIYTLDSEHRPLDAIKELISIFSGHKDGWGMAFWFMSANGYLGGVTPKSIVAAEPERVLAAARDDVEGISHG